MPSSAASQCTRPFNDFYPYYPRDAAQCDTKPWKTHSIYCSHPTGFDWSCANYTAAIEAGTFCGSRKSQLISVLREAITARGWHDPRFENGLD